MPSSRADDTPSALSLNTSFAPGPPDSPHAPRRPAELDIRIGLGLRHRREQQGLSQSTLATRCGLSHQQIQKYESGSNRIPASRLYTLAAALDCRPTELLAGGWIDAAAPRRQALQERLTTAAEELPDEMLTALVTLAETMRPVRAAG